MYSLADIEYFIYKEQPEGLIIDTNILILLFIGSYNPDCIKECNRLSDYSKDDYELLTKVISFFNSKKLIITPHIIAELSNLTITQGFREQKLYDYIQIVIAFLKKIEERHLELTYLLGVDIKLISQFGFSDMAIFEMAKSTKMPILTDDTRLATYTEAQEVNGSYLPVINFKRIVANQKLV